MSTPASDAMYDLHLAAGATFVGDKTAGRVLHYGNVGDEYRALTSGAGCLDLSSRSRICLTGVDRVRFLHGQVTNDVKRLRVGEGCYAALTTAKGRMQSDLNIFCLSDELLLDFEPGLTQTVTERLERFVVADDVQVVDVAPYYGLLSVQGPQAGLVVQALGIFPKLPPAEMNSVHVTDPNLGEIYLLNHPRLDQAGYDLFIPLESLAEVWRRLQVAGKEFGGHPCGEEAFEMARIEAGRPRFGVDMDETNIPIESGIESRAISYQKGCYIGQEVLNRIHSIGHVNRTLCGLRWEGGQILPKRGDQLWQGGKEMGYVTSAVRSPKMGSIVALGYVRREASAMGTVLTVRIAGEEVPVRVGPLLFAPEKEC